MAIDQLKLLCRKYCVRPTLVLIRLRLSQAFFERSLPLGSTQSCGSSTRSYLAVRKSPVSPTGDSARPVRLPGPRDLTLDPASSSCTGSVSSLKSDLTREFGFNILSVEPAVRGADLRLEKEPDLSLGAKFEMRLL